MDDVQSIAIPPVSDIIDAPIIEGTISTDTAAPAVDPQTDYHKKFQMVSTELGRTKAERDTIKGQLQSLEEINKATIAEKDSFIKELTTASEKKDLALQEQTANFLKAASDYDNLKSKYEELMSDSIQKTDKLSSFIYNMYLDVSKELPEATKLKIEQLSTVEEKYLMAVELRNARSFVIPEIKDVPIKEKNDFEDILKKHNQHKFQ